MTANSYSPTWFQTFLAPIAPAQTEAEVAFVARQLPQPAYRAVLDLGCGAGRHAVPLGIRGYRVTALDTNERALDEARRRAAIAGADVTFLHADMRDLSALPGAYDAVLSLWHSFGYFDAATNADILRHIRDKLSPRGRLILDVYHRDWFAAHLGTEVAARDGRRITTTRARAGDRFTVRIDYGPGAPPDAFDWQLYTPDELGALAARLGLRLILACTWCDEARPATPAETRMQLVLEKT
jgi:SAM-dependent methyltransferase